MPLLQAPALPAKVAEAQKISCRSLYIPVSSGIIERPVLDLVSMNTAGKLQRVLPLPSDGGLRASNSVILVSGKAYAIPCQPEGKYQQSVLLALSFQNIFHISPTTLPSAIDLTAHFQLVQQIFAPEAFESTALTFGPMTPCREIAIFFTLWGLLIWFSNTILLLIGQLDRAYLPMVIK